METHLSEKEAAQYSPLALAFLGDSVYEVLVRERVLLKANTSAENLHNRSVEYVRAGYQAVAAQTIIPKLTEKELAVLKRGRNATGKKPPRNADAVEYRWATALESLFGYLSLTGQKERISELFEIIWDIHS